MPTECTRAESALFTTDESPRSKAVTLEFEGRTLQAAKGSTVAAALLLQGVGPFRSTPVNSSPRAPFCMMGVCFECLVEVDGKPSRQACLTLVREGMVIKRQVGASALDLPEGGGACKLT
jgi:predicted molibdopterin-dependent oxidoreductase YjgC